MRYPAVERGGTISFNGGTIETRRRIERRNEPDTIVVMENYADVRKTVQDSCLRVCT